MHSQPLTFPTKHGVIVAEQQKWVVIGTNADDLTTHEIALAVNLLRWGCKCVQFLFPEALTKEHHAKVCAKVTAMCQAVSMDDRTTHERFECSDGDHHLQSLTIGKIDGAGHRPR